MKNKFDIIIPFGSRCATSMQLRKDGRQYESFPFDWMYHAEIKAVTDLLIGNFSNFLQKENMQPVESDTIAEHLDIANGISYIHDFESRDLDACLPTVQARYKRRVARMYHHINEAKDILLVHVSAQEMANDELLDIFAKIKSRFDGKNISLLYLFENKNATKTQKQILENGLIKYTLPNLDNSFNKLLKDYKLTFKTKMKAYWPNLVYQLKKAIKSKFVIKLVCCFIPSKAYRQKMRLIFRMGARYKD